MLSLLKFQEYYFIIWHTKLKQPYFQFTEPAVLQPLSIQVVTFLKPFSMNSNIVDISTKTIKISPGI